VVLSACETGLGDVRGSEGVYGLQRAFKMAGVRNLLMSLWQVPDNATRELMEKFYGYYLRQGLPVRPAFDRAVADQQTKYKEPYYWAGFVLVE
jgi:CHAT domain-containing protein